MSGGAIQRGPTTEMGEYADGLELNGKEASSKLSVSKQGSVGLKQTIVGKVEQDSIEATANK